MKYTLLIVFLIFSKTLVGQTYQGIWHLSKKVEADDTMTFDVNIEVGIIRSLSFFEKKVQTTSDTITEDSLQFLEIGLLSVFEKYPNEEEEEEDSCPCSIFQATSKDDLFLLLCEGVREFLNVELKDNELHLTTIRYFGWREMEYKKQNRNKKYIYVRE